jgi:hypothetical protein
MNACMHALRMVCSQHPRKLNVCDDVTGEWWEIGPQHLIRCG